MSKTTFPRNEHGIPFGAYVLSNGMPARVAGASNGRTTFVEVWGYANELGTEMTSSLVPVSREEWRKAMVKWGYSPETQPIEKKLIQWDNEAPAKLTD